MCWLCIFSLKAIVKFLQYICEKLEHIKPAYFKKIKSALNPLLEVASSIYFLT